MDDVSLVGTDGREWATEAVERARDPAEAGGAERHALTVVNTTRDGEPVPSSTGMVLAELGDRGSGQLAKLGDGATDRAPASSRSASTGPCPRGSSSTPARTTRT